MKEHRFGGDWTRDKLEKVGSYLSPYTTALKNTGFELVYIDAFAGSGEIAVGRPQDEADELVLLPEDAPPGADIIHGSALRALSTNPPFSRYIFIEKNDGRADELREAIAAFPDLISEIIRGDANDVIPKICRDTDWRKTRAVLFLDPYGMNIDWRTIEAVAATRAIDTWILLPHASAINRVLKNDGRLPESWRKKLTRFFGTSEWESHCYAADPQASFEFDLERSLIKIWGLNDILDFSVRRLNTAFEYAHPKPHILTTKDGRPLFALCFACGNKRGAEVAARIVDHIMRMG